MARTFKDVPWQVRQLSEAPTKCPVRHRHDLLGQPYAGAQVASFSDSAKVSEKAHAARWEKTLEDLRALYPDDEDYFFFVSRFEKITVVRTTKDGQKSEPFELFSDQLQLWMWLDEIEICEGVEPTEHLRVYVHAPSYYSDVCTDVSHYNRIDGTDKRNGRRAACTPSFDYGAVYRRWWYPYEEEVGKHKRDRRNTRRHLRSLCSFDDWRSEAFDEEVEKVLA